MKSGWNTPCGLIYNLGSIDWLGLFYRIIKLRSIVSLQNHRFRLDRRVLQTE